MMSLKTLSPESDSPAKHHLYLHRAPFLRQDLATSKQAPLARRKSPSLTLAMVSIRLHRAAMQSIRAMGHLPVDLWHRRTTIGWQDLIPAHNKPVRLRKPSHQRSKTVGRLQLQQLKAHLGISAPLLPSHLDP